VCVCVSLPVKKLIFTTLADTMSLNDWVNFFANDDNNSDFEGYYGEHRLLQINFNQLI